MPLMPFDRILSPYPDCSALIAVGPRWMANDPDPEAAIYLYGQRMKDE